ncbi:MAG TPA: type III pantothenate kinase [Nevskiaceae bacterium]|nr:type III pantothenate kinase [Nevskiaceae bacterium]
MILLLDVGNSRVKWAEAHGESIALGGAIAHEGKPADVVARLDLDEPDAVWVATVTGHAHELTLARAITGRWQRPPHFVRAEAEAFGLKNAYEDPRRLGVDRWLAMIGAWRACGGACVVADAGTALTVDAIDADGRHLGGLIAAGLKTSESAVLGATRFPTRATPLPVHDGLGLDTEACVRQGARLSVLGAMERAAALLPGARCFLTGGDAEALATGLDSTWEVRPALVFEGLLALARA